MICGFSLGAAVGGLVAASIIPRFGWPAVFVVGGVIPPQDYPELYAAGAKAIFGPGTSIADAAIDLLQKLGAKADAKSQQAAE